MIPCTEKYREVFRKHQIFQQKIRKKFQGELFLFLFFGKFLTFPHIENEAKSVQFSVLILRRLPN